MNRRRIRAVDVVPLIGQLRHYSARWARADIVAGFATAVTLLPQGLAFGALAGLSPVAGLVVCVLAIAISAAAGLADQSVAVVGPAVGGLPAITWPQVTLEDLWALLLPAAGMTLVASVETFSAVRQAGAEADGRISLDRETAALGAASLVTGMLTGFPPMASTSRTLSARSSAHSQLFQLIAAGIVVFVLFTGGPLVALLPMPVLAAILVVGAPKLIDVIGLRWLWRGWRAEGVIALVAVAGVLGLGVLRGLLIAVILSASQLIRRAARPHDSLLAIVDEGHPPQEIADGDASPHPDILIYRVDAPLFFANARRVRQRVLALVTAREPRPRCVICDMQAVFYVDATAANALAQLTAELQALGCRLVLARVREPVLAVLRANPYHDGATQRLPVFPGVRQAFTAVREP